MRFLIFSIFSFRSDFTYQFCSRFIFLIAFFATTCNVKALDVSCIYFDYDWNEWGGHYSCMADVEVSEAGLHLTSVDGIHKAKYLISDVKGFIVVRKKADYLMHGIKKFFPNYNEIHILDSGLKQVNRSDFKDDTQLQTIAITKNQHVNISRDAFVDLVNLEYLDLSSNLLPSIPDLTTLAKLRELYISNNNIETLLAADIAGNSKLKVIFIYNNKLKRIESTALEQLIGLEKADLSGNACIDVKFPEKHSLAELRSEIANKCV